MLMSCVTAGRRVIVWDIVTRSTTFCRCSVDSKTTSRHSVDGQRASRLPVPSPTLGRKLVCWNCWRSLEWLPALMMMMINIIWSERLIHTHTTLSLSFSHTRNHIKRPLSVSFVSASAFTKIFRELWRQIDRYSFTVVLPSSTVRTPKYYGKYFCLKNSSCWKVLCNVDSRVEMQPESSPCYTQFLSTTVIKHFISLQGYM